MKIVHTGDWHIGKFLNDYSLLEDQAYFLSQFTAEMKQLQPDAILIAGDIYDRSVPSAQAVSLLHHTLEELAGDLQIPVLLIAGNHDSGERLSFGSSLFRKSGLFITGTLSPDSIAEVTLEDTFGLVHFYSIPYFDRFSLRTVYPEESFKTDQEAFDFLAEKLSHRLIPEHRNILMLHGFFAKSAPTAEYDEQVGGSNLLNLTALPDFDYIALGHIHGARTAGDDHIRYAGSPLKYSVDEADQEKQYLIIELSEKGNCTVSSRRIQPLRDLKVISDRFDVIATPEYAASISAKDYLFFALTDTQPVLDVAKRLKSFYPNLLGVSFPQYRAFLQKVQGTQEPVENTLKERPTDQLFADFFTHITGKELSSQQQKLVTDTLLRLHTEDQKEER